MEKRRSVYEQPGTKVEGILSQQGGFQVSEGNEREAKGNEKREREKGKAESKGIAL
jgi:hypothetical protein